MAALIMLATTMGHSVVSAQDLRGFATGGVTSDVNHQRFPSMAGGLVLNVGQPWLSVGAQGETFWLWPYFAGRGTVFGQGNLTSKGRIRPFVLGGAGFGVYGGPMVGGGVEIRQANRRLGVRVTVEDYLSQISEFDCAPGSLRHCGTTSRETRSHLEHQVALRVGLLF
jgi:hypothetical protein